MAIIHCIIVTLCQRLSRWIGAGVGLACLAAELSRVRVSRTSKKFLLEGCSHLCHIFLSVSIKNILYLGEGETYDIPPLLVVSPCFGSVVLVVVE